MNIRTVEDQLELVALRHQVAVLRRQRKGRLQLSSTDRLLWVWLYRIWPQALNAMVLVMPATVTQWHRNGFRLYWLWRSGSRHSGRPELNSEIRGLIRQMSVANPLWGAPRIHGELLKLGIAVSQATAGRYMPWRRRVDEDVAILIPHSPGCAVFPLPVLHGRASLAAV